MNTLSSRQDISADLPDENEDPSNGIAVRAEVISALTSIRISEALHSLSSGMAAIALENVISLDVANAVLGDLEQDQGWSEECWILTENANVSIVPVSDFEIVSPALRFSRNECLRKPKAQAWNLRGLLSAIISDEAREFLSEAFGERVKFRSADIARYHTGNYLRRHSDIFEHRRFGLVWFLSSGWSLGMGGELIVESPAGEATVIHPVQRTVGILAIRPDCFHQVARTSTSSWVRYSIATHFSADDTGES